MQTQGIASSKAPEMRLHLACGLQCCRWSQVGNKGKSIWKGSWRGTTGSSPSLSEQGKDVLGVEILKGGCRGGVGARSRSVE